MPVMLILTLENVVDPVSEKRGPLVGTAFTKIAVGSGGATGARVGARVGR
jgi:hypothetical protein